MNNSADNHKIQLMLDDPACKASTSQYEVINCYPHDTTAFTEGLQFYNDFLYESTGLCDFSSVRRLDPSTGEILQKELVKDLCAGEDCDGTNSCFAEGLTVFQDKIFQLTWKSQKGFIYNAHDLSLVGDFKYEGEGWGLTHDNQFLIMSNGSKLLQFLDPTDGFKVVNTISVKGGGRNIRLNELEYVKGSILANLYPTDSIVQIDLKDSRIREQIDLSAIRPKAVKPCATCDLNGIAYNETSGTLFVTGKRWPLVFEIRLKSMPI